MKSHLYYVYILTNQNNTVLYVGVTNDIIRRVWEHKNHVDKTSFTARYNIEKLVYYETFQFIQDAIDREKQLKAGSRDKKVDLVISINPDCEDLYEYLMKS
jgi:putative endonuclease